MDLINLKCQDCIGSATDGCYVNCEKESLLLGQGSLFNYLIYMYFNLPSNSLLRHLKQARLILFKIPTKCDENRETPSAQYSASPLLDFFSVYGCEFCEPEVDYSRSVHFQDTACRSYTEIDITDIVRSWSEGSVENKGLLLTGNKHTRKIIYASNQHCITAMRPRLRLIYGEGNICKPLSVTPCTVEVRS